MNSAASTPMLLGEIFNIVKEIVATLQYFCIYNGISSCIITLTCFSTTSAAPLILLPKIFKHAGVEVFFNALAILIIPLAVNHFHSSQAYAVQDY